MQKTTQCNDSLYFAMLPNYGLVKIGRAKDPCRRVSSGATFCPDPDIFVLAVVAGAGYMEKAVHKAFAGCHRHKELFAADAILLDWIRAGCKFDEMPRQFDVNMKSDVPHFRNAAHVTALAKALGG